MNNWNGLDFLLFLIFFLNMILGMSRGATKEIISMMCLSVALIFTIKFTLPLTHFLLTAPAIQDVLDSALIKNFMIAIGANPLTLNFLQELSYSISLLICFVGVFSIGEAVLSISGFVEVFSFPYSAWNRKVGAALGCTRGYIINVIIICILSLHMFNNTNQSAGSMLSGSYFVNLFQAPANKLNELIGKQEVERYQELYEHKNLFNEKDIYKLVPKPELPAKPSTGASDGSAN